MAERRPLLLVTGGLKELPSGDVLPIAAGGTVAATAADARTALGLGTAATKAGPSGDIVGTTDTQTLSAKTITGLKETKVALTGTEIDLAAGNVFSKTISANTAFTVTNVPSTGTVACFILDLTNGGSKTVSWSTGFTAVKYAGGSAPTLTASGRDLLGFITHDGGSIWNCLLLGKDVK